jgi:hypothetical protein
VVRACRRGKVEFSLVMTKNPAITRALAAIPDAAWTPVRYPGAVRDPDTGAWISDAEVAEVPYTAFAATKDRITARLVVRRVKDARYPDALFPVWRYHPFFTNSALVAVNEVWEHLVDDHDTTVSYGAVAATSPIDAPNCSTPPMQSAEPPQDSQAQQRASTGMSCSQQRLTSGGAQCAWPQPGSFGSTSVNPVPLHLSGRDSLRCVSDGDLGDGHVRHGEVDRSALPGAAGTPGGGHRRRRLDRGPPSSGHRRC